MFSIFISFFIKHQRLIILFLAFQVLFFSVKSQTNTDSDYRIKTVVLDAGHGGKDPGAVCKKGYEKDIALGVVLKLGHYIDSLLEDVEVIYTRDNDVFVELHKRAKVANTSNADIFISVHANANESNKPFGTETYVMGIHRTSENLAVAKKENSVILKEEDHFLQYDGFDPNSSEGYIVFSLLQNVYLDQSLNFAAKVQNQFKTRTGRVDRGVKQAGFLVLWKTTMPSVLVETGFISNPEEATFLLSEQGQDYLASAIFRAFRNYKNMIEGRPEVKDEEDILNKSEKNIVTPEKDSGIKTVNTNNTEQKDSVADNSNESINSESKSEKPDNEKHKIDTLYNSVCFKIQIKNSSTLLDSNSEEFKGLENVSYYEENNLYKYIVGNFKNYNDVLNYQKEVKKLFPDAFPVAFKSGEKIPLKDAIQK